MGRLASPDADPLRPPDLMSLARQAE
jgi:hypothetical protein